jgi:hypothetical protein
MSLGFQMNDNKQDSFVLIIPYLDFININKLDSYII